MAVTIAQLQAVLGLNTTNFTQGMAQATTQTKGFQDLFKELKSPLGVASAALVGLAADSVAAGLQFNQAFGNIAAQTGATGEALDKLTTQFSGNFLHMTQGADEASQGFARLIQRTGLTGQALDRLTQQESQLARVTGQNLPETIDATTRASQKWGLTTDQTSAFLDRLLLVSQRTGVNVNTLAQNVTTLGAPLQDMGLSAERAAQMLGDWDKAGLNVSQTAFGLRQAIAKMTEAGLKPSSEEFARLLGHIQAMHNPTEQLSAMIALFGKRTGEELTLAMKKGVFGADEFTKKLEDAKDAVKRTDEAVDPLKKAMTDLGHQFQESIKPSKELTESWIDMAHAMQGLVKQVSSGNDAFEKWRGVIGNKPQTHSAIKNMFGDPNEIAGPSWFDGMTDRFKKMHAQVEANAVAWDLLRHDIVDFGNEAQQVAKKAEPLTKAEMGIITPKEHHTKLTEAQKEAAELKKLTESAQEELNQLETGAGVSTAKLAGHFRLMSHESIVHLADLRHAIDEFVEKDREMKRWTSMMDEAKMKVVELKNEGLPTAEALRNIFPTIPQGMLEGLAKELDLEKDLRKTAEEHQRAKEHELRLNQEGARKVADLQAEYMRLTHTRYEDIVSLELYGKTFDEVTEKAHRQTVQDAAFWMRTVDAQKELIANTREWKAAEEGLTKTTEELKLKLALKTPLEENARAMRASLTEFDRLPAAARLVEENAEAQIRWKKTYADLSVEHQHAIDLFLQETHALAIKTKADEEADAAAKKSIDLTKTMTDHLAQLNEHIREISNPGTNRVSKFVTDVLAEQLHLTDEQDKMLKQIIAKEKELSDLEKHAAVMKKISSELRSEFTHMFEDMMHGGKNAFATLEQDFTKMLQKMAAEYLASRLTNLFMGLIGGLVPGGGKGIDMSQIVGRASGGSLAPGQLAMVGENGPEMFQPNAAGRIIPSNQSGGQGGGVTVNMTVNATDANSFRYSSNQLAQQLAQQLAAAQRRNG